MGRGSKLRFAGLGLVGVVALAGCVPDETLPGGAQSTGSRAASGGSDVAGSPAGAGVTVAPGTPSEAAPGGVVVVDDAGRTWSFSSPPVRIVSLVPAATELLIAIGAGDRLVARTDFDDLPPSLDALPSVGGGLGPSLEVLVSVSPDLVIRFEGPSDRETPAGLDRLGIPHVAVRPDGVADVFRILEVLGEVTGRENEAATLRVSIERQLDAVAAAARARPPVRVAILLGGDPPWIAGGSTFIHELAAIAGADNALADASALYAPVSVEEIWRKSPDLLILTGTGRLPAGLQGMPYQRAPALVLSPGPRIGEAAAAMLRLFEAASEP
jgi:iron complex transport system substrate-binding protein